MKATEKLTWFIMKPIKLKKSKIKGKKSQVFWQCLMWIKEKIKLGLRG